MHLPTFASTTLTALTALGGSLALSIAAAGCMPPTAAPPPAASIAKEPAAPAPSLRAGNGNPTERPVYRLDFVLSSNEGTSNATSTTFTLNVGEHDKGEAHVGKNIALSTASAPGVNPVMAPGPRQDVGLKIAASYRAFGDDIFLEVATEMSAFEPPTTIRKVVVKGNALASPGKSTLVMSLDDDHKHYQLLVTPTKLR